jgi:hypothetical protein
MTETAEPLAQAAEDPQDRSLQDDLRALADDARGLADAELTYQKARAAYAGRESARIALLGIAGGALLFFAAMALVVGSLIALTPDLGPWAATAAVCGSLLLLALLVAMVGVLRLRRMKAVLSDKDTAA